MNLLDKSGLFYFVSKPYQLMNMIIEAGITFPVGAPSYPWFPNLYLKAVVVWHDLKTWIFIQCSCSMAIS